MSEDSADTNGPSSCRESVLNLSTWFRSPPSVVGDKITPLTNYIRGTDRANLGGCKSQCYTTWASLPHSYVASFYTEFRAGGSTLPTQSNQVTNLFYTPTPEKVNLLSAIDRTALAKGKKFMVKGQPGPLIIKQAVAKQILASGSTASNAQYHSLYLAQFVDELTGLYNTYQDMDPRPTVATWPPFESFYYKYSESEQSQSNNNEDVQQTNYQECENYPSSEEGANLKTDSDQASERRRGKQWKESDDVREVAPAETPKIIIPWTQDILQELRVAAEINKEEKEEFLEPETSQQMRAHMSLQESGLIVLVSIVELIELLWEKEVFLGKIIHVLGDVERKAVKSRNLP